MVALFTKKGNDAGLRAAPIDGVDVLLADLDGVVYKGKGAIDHAVGALSRAAGSGVRVGYITNNASRTDAQVAEHLSSFGLSVGAADVVTSPQAAVRLLSGLVPAGSTILVVGGIGLTSEVERAGFTVTRQADDLPAAVIQGFSPDVGWKDLAQASFALHRGIPWVATNTDWTIPVEGGIAPGNGTLVSAVHTAVGILPVVGGKPEKAIFDAAVARFGAENPLFIGDRLDTDIIGANRAGMRSVQVLTGIDGPKQLLAADKDSRPTFILDDLRGLFEPYPDVQVADDLLSATAGTAVIRLRGNSLEIAKAGDSGINRLRAACSLLWASGRPIYGLSVAPELYS
ncbi:HAD-IIA family hydrolase [Subtercola frigoramans]|uniref:HAD superfamily hydrolase (TIGR01450 family) n=1 Tax=Subtercola frigoramans TaxID=120298 RepID=A0ABS2L650_9MICO|nr:HAD-IIA family hydrolase [Subtercola frigoramans]MBM7472570.1 HAD superfamily hydrolase (TIGR01450 family) [Subtercola frigoramans]